VQTQLTPFHSPGTCNVSIGRVKRLLEHFSYIFRIAICTMQPLPVASQE
jgi:hypothetical protein